MSTRQLVHGDLENEQFPRTREVLEARLAQGTICIAAYRKSIFAGFIWLSLKDYHEDEVKCTYVIPPRSAWDFDLFVEPQFRNGVTFARLWQEAVGFLMRKDIVESFSRISAFAPESLAAHRRMGAEIIGSVMFFQCFGVQLTVGNIKPYASFCWRGGLGPSFKLR